MTKASPLDPLALWRSLVSQTEKDVNEVAFPTMKSGEFAKLANIVLGASLTGKGLKREMLDRYFRSLNLPTRSDMETLANRLQVIEDHLIGMSATLDRIAGAKSRGNGGYGQAAGGPSRTKRPPPTGKEVATAPASAHVAATARRTKKTRS